MLNVVLNVVLMTQLQSNQKPSPLYITKYKCKMNIPIIGYVTDFPLCHRFPVSGVNARGKSSVELGVIVPLDARVGCVCAPGGRV